jgi:hypothetical protein
MTLALTAPNIPALEFAQSSSQAVAVHGGLMDKMAQYAPRISAFLKMVSYGSITSQGITASASGVTIASGLVIAAGVMMLCAGAIMIFYGNKQKQKERAAKLGESAEVERIPSDPISRIFHEISKVASPAKYPIESASGIGVVASLCLGVSGALMVPVNFYLIGMAALGGIASAIALFGHEKNKAPQQDGHTATQKDGLSFAQSQSQSQGLIDGEGKGLKGNPVRLSSILLIGTSIVALANGIANSAPFFVAAGVCSLIANVMMAVFVRKNDYNVNAAKQSEPEAKARPTHQVSQASSNQRLQDIPAGYAIA